MREEANGIVQDLQLATGKPLTNQQIQLVIDLYKHHYGKPNYINAVKNAYLSKHMTSLDGESMLQFRQQYLKEIVTSEPLSTIIRDEAADPSTLRAIRNENLDYTQKTFLHIDSFKSSQRIPNGFQLPFSDVGISARFVGDIINIHSIQLSPFNCPLELANFYNTIYIEIEEFKSQAYYNNNIRYHFIATTSPNGLTLRARLQDSDSSIFIFNKVISRPTTLTFRFYSPDSEILLAPPIIPVAWASAASVTPTVFTSSNHGLTTGDFVYFNNITLPDAAVVSAINSINGHLITVVDANNFSIVLPTSLIDPIIWTATNPNATVQIASRRFLLQLVLS